MRTWTKLGGVAAVLLATGTAFAADHADGPGVTMEPTGDINDVYTWMSADKANLELIMTIGGTSAPTAFGDTTQYVFHIVRSEMPLVDDGTATKLICEFASNTDAQCWLGDSDYVTGDPSAAAGMKSDSGKVRVHAGAHADPFFFFLDGLKATVGAVIAAATAVTPKLLFYPSGCPKLDAATVTALQALLTTPPKNNFKGLNSLGLVVEIALDAIPGKGNHLSVWAGTYGKN